MEGSLTLSVVNPVEYTGSALCNQATLEPGYANELLFHHPQYRELELLGCGSQSFSILAVDKNNEDLVAIKVFRCNDWNMEEIRLEACLSRSLAHPHIIQVREVLKWQGIIGLVTEYAVGGALSTLVVNRGGLPESAAKWYFQQTVMAVDFCHQKGFACRDIKLENVLLVNNAGTLVKLCVLGCPRGKELRSPPGSLIGLPACIAPEILLSAQSGMTYDGQRADMWSLGVLLLNMLTAHSPFSTRTLSKPTAGNSYLRYLVMNAPLNAPQSHTQDVSELCMDLLMRLLEGDPKTRCNMGHVLNHPWFLSGLPPDAMSMNRIAILST